jgi:hypothetical protein
LGAWGFDIQNDGHRKRHPRHNLHVRYSFHSQYGGLFILWVWGLILGHHSRQKASDGSGDLRGVWVDGGLAESQIREEGLGNRSQKWVPKMGPKMDPKMGSKNGPQNGPKKQVAIEIKYKSCF